MTISAPRSASWSVPHGPGAVLLDGDDAGDFPQAEESRCPPDVGRYCLTMERVRFYYDVVCPYSYLESHVILAQEEARRIEVEWLPFELRPAPRPLLQVRGDHLRTDWTQHVYRRALAAGDRDPPPPLPAPLHASSGRVPVGR